MFKSVRVNCNDLIELFEKFVKEKVQSIVGNEN